MTILNEYVYEYVITHVVWKSYSWVGIVLALCIIFGGLWLTFSVDDNMEWLGGIVIGICLVITFFIFFVSEEKIPVTRYEVTITDENFSFNEFNDKYKLIEERGDILMIEEKNDENP